MTRFPGWRDKAPSGTKGPKFGNTKCEQDGIVFDSKRERKRYGDLTTLERAGKIRNLELQPKYELKCGGVPVKIRDKNGVGRQSTYTADFRYFDVDKGQTVVEDSKGFDTPRSRLARAVVEAEYGIEIVIV